MEEINATTITETVEKTTSETEEKKNIEEKFVRSPLFLIFAEFMGYTSPLIEWADKLCNGKTIESFKEKAIEVDALNIFNKMKKEFSIEDIRQMWDEFYEVVLQDYDENLAKAEKEKLPF